MKSKKLNIRKYLSDCKKYANAFASCLSQNDQGRFWEAWHLVESSENQNELQKRTEVIDELTKSLITRYEQSILESRKDDLSVCGREIRWTFEQILDEIGYLDVIQYCLYHKNEKKATYEPFSDEYRFSFAEGMYFHMFPTPAKRKEWEEYAQGDAILDFPELCEFLLNSNVPLLYRGLIAFSAVDIMYHSPQNVEFLKNYGKEMFMPMSKYTIIDGNGYTAEEEYWREGGNTGMLPQRITPSQVNVLKNKEIFVFGSNIEGKHNGGAAFATYKKFGAIYGVGEGLQGHSYAIPTTDGIDNLRPAVERFTSFAKQHKELTFYVTAIGCGNAGYKPEEVAPLFLEVALRCGNVNLPLSFWKVIIDYNSREEDFEKTIKNLINVVQYFHRHCVPEWSEEIDDKIVSSLDRSFQWELGVQLKVISPLEEEPQIKALPKELIRKIKTAFKEV